MISNFKNLHWIVFLFSILFYSAPYSFAQNLGKGLLGSGFTYDSRQTKASSKAAGMMFDTMFGEMPGYSIDIELYRFNGSFDQAVKAIQVPSNADVQPSGNQTAGMALGMFQMMFEEQIDEAFDPSWRDKAQKKSSEWGSLAVDTFTFSVGRDKLMSMENLNSGDTVSFLSVNCSNPFVDIANLEIIEGTWISISKVTLVIPDMSAEREFGGLLGDDGDDDMAGPDMDIDVETMPGSVFVDAEDVSYDLNGELNWLIEKPLRSSVDFYLSSSKRHCSIDSENTAIVDDDEVPYYTLYCLTHEGELKSGDDVIAVDITKPSRDLLSEVLGRNQGTWTIISINRWVEDE